MSVVILFGSEEGLYNEFAVKCFRIFLMLCPLNGFRTVAAIYLQAEGKPVKSAVITLCRQIVFLLPAVFILPCIWASKEFCGRDTLPTAWRLYLLWL